MRRAARTDGNHGDVAKALRQIGATVQHLHTVGHGCPDLLVGYHGVNILVEVKDGSLKLSAQALTDDEVDWHAMWRGQICIVTSVAEAISQVTKHAMQEEA